MILSAEILGGRHYLDNCRLFTYVNPNSATRGVVDVGGNSNVLTANTTQSSTFSVKNTSLYARNFDSNTALINIRNRGTTQNVNVEVDGLEIDADNFNRVLRLDVISGTAASDFIIVDGIKTGLTGKNLAIIDSNYSAFPMRMQPQSGSEDVTIDTAASTKNGTTVSFKYAYPKVPVVLTARSGEGYMNNRIGICWADNVLTTGLLPRISTDDGTNFSSADTVTLNWTAGISEI